MKTEIQAYQHRVFHCNCDTSFKENNKLGGKYRIVGAEYTEVIIYSERISELVK